MNFLFVNVGNCLESAAMAVKNEGHNIYFYKPQNMSKKTGEGIFTEDEMTTDIFKVLNKVGRKNTIVIFDDNGQGNLADFLRNDGYKVIGGSAFAEKIEYERDLGTKLMEKIGLEVPPTHTFEKFSDAITFVESRDDDEKFVFKPNGEDMAGSAKTYTSKGKQDLIDYLKWIEEDQNEHHYTIDKFELQEFIDGYEADFAGYFDGEKFMEGSCVLDIEEKKSGDGNKGEATGCMGNIVIFLDKSKYMTEYIEKLTPLLKKEGYVGQISINNIFEKETGKPYALEFTPRFGWDANTTEQCLILESGQKLSDFYIALANQQKFKFPANAVGIGVRIYTGSISLKKEDVCGRYFSYDDDIEKNLYYYAVSIEGSDKCIIEDNPVLIVNTSESSVPTAIKNMYDNILPRLFIPDAYYRMEIGARATEVIKFLREKGWI